MDEVTEVVCHGTLEGGSIVLQTKGHYSIGECAPRDCECSLVTIFFLDLDLFISKKPVHEGKDLMSSAYVNDLVNEWGWEVVFGISQIQIPKVHRDADDALFFVHENRVGNLSGASDCVYQSFLA